MQVKKFFSHQVFWILLALLIALIFSFFVLYLRPAPAVEEPRVAPRLVRTVEARESSEPLVFRAYGVVRPEREITLRSEVSGRVIDKSSNFVLGGVVKQDEVLLRLDPRDYLDAIEQQKAAVESAWLDLRLEEGRQVVAKKEWEQLGDSLTSLAVDEELVLRRPHLKDKQLAYAAAISRLEKAEVDYERTVLRAPFDAVVLSEIVEVGDFVTPQTQIGRIAATDTFQVMVSVPMQKLKWIRLPDDEGNGGSGVVIMQDVGGGLLQRRGKISRLLADLDPNGRMARVLVDIDDPLGTGGGKPFPLLIGTYVQAEFEGPVVEEVVVIPSDAIRDTNKVWVKNKENLLEIRDVDIVQRSGELVFIDRGVAAGEDVVVSHLPLAIPGIPLVEHER